MNPFDQKTDRYNTQSVKWDYTEEIFGIKDVLPMWVADMDFKAPKQVVAALAERASHGIFGYTSTGFGAKKAVQNWMEKRHSWNITQESIVFSSGVVTALSMAIQSLTDPGDSVLIQSPVYHPFFDMTEKNNRTIINNQLKLVQGKYEIDFADLEEKLSDPAVKLMLLCNPHNPGGRVWSSDELKKLGELCAAHHVIVVSDEIHSDLMLFGHKHVPFASISKELADISITCMAPSKTFNLAGLQSSAIIIPNKDLRTRYEDYQKRQGFFTLNTFGITGMEAAYTYGAPWLEELTAYLEGNVNTVTSFIAEKLPELKVIQPDSTYLVWIDCRSLSKTDAELKALLLEKGRLALEEGTKYGPGGEGFVRMNIGCPRSVVLEGLTRLEKAFS
ncbi:MalY/PatB family protein [Peribacillus frigoritolerans]|uniref:MalY/PatB family protein n=1 Tax=Peribacillus frigoritolerans TaxID=450367 RepID=UPI00105A7210|nr:MalY/PatB family protein [Peribacillus frigoritolerans]TDL78595.1 pyridoxal phosphate-dependent aminotransferase [Peribacillus frigoritolerans]